MAAEDYTDNGRTRRDPPNDVVLITANDTVTFSPRLQAISIGTAGDLAVKLGDSTAAVTIPAHCLAIGIQHSMEITTVMKTNTTASELTGWR